MHLFSRLLSLHRTILWGVIVGIFFISSSTFAGFSVVTDAYTYFIIDENPKSRKVSLRHDFLLTSIPVDLYGHNIHTKESFHYSIHASTPVKGLVANNEVVCAWTENFLLLKRHGKPAWESQFSFSGTGVTIKDVVVYGTKAYFVADALYTLSHNKDLLKSYFPICLSFPKLIVHQGKGYMVSDDGFQLYEINLQTLDIERACPFECTITQFIPREGKGYVLFRAGFGIRFYSLDLKSFTLEFVKRQTPAVSEVYIEEPFAYLVSSNTIDLIDLRINQTVSTFDAPYVAVSKLYPFGNKAYVLTEGKTLIVLDFRDHKLEVLLKCVVEFYLLGDYGYALTENSISIDIILLKAGRRCGTLQRKKSGEQIAVTQKGLFSPEGYIRDLWVPPFIPEHALPLMYDSNNIIFDWKSAMLAEVKSEALINWFFEEDDPQYFYQFAQTVYMDSMAATALLIKALEINDPDARSFMYLAFRDGKWGVPQSETLALFYDDGRDE